MGGESAEPGEPLTPAERQFLLDSGIPSDAFDPQRQRQARASLQRRAEQTRRNASPELTLDQVAGLLGLPRSSVRDRVRQRVVYAFERDDELRLPEWQFPDGQLVRTWPPCWRR